VIRVDTVAEFFSPTGNIECRIRDDTVDRHVICQSRPNPHTVGLLRDDGLVTCEERRCVVRRRGDDAFLLDHGQSVVSRGIRCSSAENGITCVLRGTGRGFRIDRDGGYRVGPATPAPPPAATGRSSRSEAQALARRLKLGRDCPLPGRAGAVRIVRRAWQQRDGVLSILRPEFPGAAVVGAMRPRRELARAVTGSSRAATAAAVPRSR
jgi:hypothetical protein